MATKTIKVPGPQTGVLGLLGMLFVGLKLTHYIDWSWWWVTFPFWGGLALFIGTFLVVFVILALGVVINAIAEK